MSTDYNKIFHKVPVQIPNKSGFDMSFENLFTAKVGTLTPVVSEFLLPNDTITLGVKGQVQLPPMATDFYGRVQAKMEAFFVPCRLLYGGWQEMMTHPTSGDLYPDGSSTHQKAKYLPFIEASGAVVGPGSLADYLGFKVSPDSDSISYVISNPLKFVAYHKIWDDWYRDSRIQQSCFSRPVILSGTQSTQSVSEMPYVTRYDDSPIQTSTNMVDSFKVTDLRQRNWSKDYFTNSTPLPQAGIGSNLAFQVNEGTGTFSIASLRVANSLQQWLERNNLAGYRYGDQIKARFGVYPADAVLDRSIYLGSTSFDIYNKSVYQTAPLPSGAPSDQNPFNSVGTKFASPMGVGDGSLVDTFTATEHGYIFVMFSIVPSQYYGTGVDKHFFADSMADFPDPMLAGVGDEEIDSRELDESFNSWTSVSIFGYTQRFSRYKFVLDQVHGLLRDGQELENFALQRSFNSSIGETAIELSSEFLEIPTNYLDHVSAVVDNVSEFGAWCDLYFSFKKSSTLPAYSLPTLGEPKDTHTEIIDNGGKRL